MSLRHLFLTLSLLLSTATPAQSPLTMEEEQLRQILSLFRHSAETPNDAVRNLTEMGFAFQMVGAIAEHFLSPTTGHYAPEHYGRPSFQTFSAIKAASHNFSTILGEYEMRDQVSEAAWASNAGYDFLTDHHGLRVGIAEVGQMAQRLVDEINTDSIATEQPIPNSEDVLFAITFFTALGIVIEERTATEK